MRTEYNWEFSSKTKQILQLLHYGKGKWNRLKETIPKAIETGVLH